MSKRTFSQRPARLIDSSNPKPLFVSSSPPSSLSTTSATVSDEPVPTSSAKKHKTENANLVIFTIPDEKADVYIKVFNTELHVHSLMLKSKSAFFREALDTKCPVIVPSQFRSKWYTNIDDAGDWNLSQEPEQAGNENRSPFKGDSALEEKAFEKMLCAIFGHVYQIANGAELLCVTKLAIKYRCLPAVSSSLWGPIGTSPRLVPDISINPSSVLFAAYKLRHKELFKEAFIHVLGPASSPRYTKLTDPVLRSMAHLVYVKFQSKLLEAHEAILDLHSNPKKYGVVVQQMAKLATKSTRDSDGKVMKPMYFRQCFEMACEKRVCEEELERILGPLMKSKLYLDKTGATAGKGDFKDSFLCFEPNRIPWDENERDW
ncbi:hypothetical protein LCER1_G003336 [Lachnellula cervina]|uniref:BTB domain-containing protein n=1 Tax=Lachnellula cervina TaxID=1316786 RepID=A0A7D8USS0_9HELO|nr:hypothetical protein LCER1_G003336 [Lachnellula cervina]